MKRMTKYKYVAAVCALSMLTACNFEEVNTNQFEMTPEEGLMDGFAVGGLITKMQRSVIPVGTQADDTDVINQYQIAYNLSGDIWSGFFGQNNSWTSGNDHPQLYLQDGKISATYTWAYTNSLDPWKRLKADSEANGTPEVFALAQVLKISAWHKALESFGPIPYTHAGEPTMYIPFDSEETVYRTMFEDLTAAIAELTNNANNGVKIMSDYDAVYAGDATKWVKYANSLMLRLAIRVRFADETLAKTYAKQALEHPIGVMSSKDDEAKMATGAGQVFRNNISWLSDNYNEARMGSSIYSYLVGYQDPRLPAYFHPTTQDQYGAVVGTNRYMACPTGHVYGQNEFFETFSKPNIQISTPTYWLRTSEVLFLRAEAALAWGGEFGDPETLYKEGIAMSFAENGLSNSVDDYLAGDGKPVDLTCYQGSYNFSHPAPCQTTVQFEGNSEQKLEKIMIQKWLALYPNGQEAWTEWRRTGYPKLHKVLNNRGTSQGATLEGGIRRMIYPQSFYTTAEDKAIYDEALKLLNNGQGAQDYSDVNLWWDCK